MKKLGMSLFLAGTVLASVNASAIVVTDQPYGGGSLGIAHRFSDFINSNRQAKEQKQEFEWKKEDREKQEQQSSTISKILDRQQKIVDTQEKIIQQLKKLEEKQK